MLRDSSQRMKGRCKYLKKYWASLLIKEIQIKIYWNTVHILVVLGDSLHVFLHILWQLLFSTIYSRMWHSKQPERDKNSISLCDRADLFSNQDNKGNIFLWSKGWAGFFLSSLLWTRGFPSSVILCHTDPPGPLLVIPMGIRRQRELMPT